MTTASISFGVPKYSVPEGALRRWAEQRVRREDRADGGAVFAFALSGSTCNGTPLEMVLTVNVGPDGRIESTSSVPADHDLGFGVQCVTARDEDEARRWLEYVGPCKEAVGLTIEQAAFRDWHEEPSGCLCTAGHRRHKWRNVLQTLHFVEARRP